MYERYSDASSLRIQQKGNNKTVQPQYFSKNQNENHSNEKFRLLSRSTNTCIAHDSDCKARCKTCEANA